MYINGATAEPLDNTIKIPKRRSTTIIGKSHHFFLSLKNPQRSVMRDMVGYLVSVDSEYQVIIRDVIHGYFE